MSTPYVSRNRETPVVPDLQFRDPETLDDVGVEAHRGLGLPCDAEGWGTSSTNQLTKHFPVYWVRPGSPRTGRNSHPAYDPRQRLLEHVLTPGKRRNERGTISTPLSSVLRTKVEDQDGD